MKILCVFGRNAYGDAARGEGYEHANFMPALHALGHETVLFESFDRSAYADFAEMNRAFLTAIETQRPGVVLCVLMGYELWTETLDRARTLCAGPIINWGTDDSWKYEQFARYIAPHVDCYATTSARAFEQAQRDGHTNVVLTQWAAGERALAAPLPASQCRYKVSFVGSAYGNRRRWIERLARRGIHVHCFGYGWPKGPVAAADIPRIVRESVISLNFGDSGLHLRGLWLYRSRQIKARVFEVPGAGGFLLTEAADGLDQFYDDGDEIAVFDSEEQLVDRIHYYLEHPDERDRVALAGHERTVRMHTYTRRFQDLLAESCHRVNHRRASTAVTTLTDPAEKHRRTVWLRVLRVLLVAPLSLLFGKTRGARAARRLLFEVSWRVTGAKTYSASGWPGRLFYRES